MEPNDTWINDWRIGISPAEEGQNSRQLVEIFEEFWTWARLEEKSKSTRQRYSAGLHALGGWAIEKVVGEDKGAEIEQLLFEATDTGEGPLIYPDRESWQNELDAVCRKFNKFLASRR